MTGFSIVATVVIGLIVSFLVTENTSLTGIPLFLVVFVSILFGALVASVVTVINSLKYKWTMFGQRGKLNKSYKTMGELQQRVSQLEEENATLRDQLKQLA